MDQRMSQIDRIPLWAQSLYRMNPIRMTATWKGRICKASILLLLGAICLSGCISTTQPDNRLLSSSPLIYGFTGQIDGLDPHIHRSTELGIPMRQVYDTLIYRDPNTYEFVPGLAEEWAISPDGLIYTFHLRNDVEFHDGTPFNAQSVTVNLDRIVDPETRSQRAMEMLGPFSEHRIIDDLTIQIVLFEPFHPLLDSLSQVYLGIASPVALAEYSRNRYQFHQVGTGPYRFVEYVPGDKIILQRNPNYAWGPEFYSGLSENSTETIQFQIITDPDNNLMIEENHPLQITDIRLGHHTLLPISNQQLRMIPVTIPGQPIQLLFNTQNFPTDRRAVRQSLLFGTNRSAIVDAVFQDFSSVAWGPISSNTLYYSTELRGIYDHDTLQAQTLFEAQGFLDTNNDGVLEFGGIDIELTIIILANDPMVDIAQHIANQWQTLGVRVTIEVMPSFATLVERLESGDYHLVGFQISGLDPFLLSEFFHSSGQYNWINVSDPELDHLLTEASRQADSSIRQVLYAQIQQTIMENALMLPIGEVVRIQVATEDVQNLNYDSSGWYPLMPNVVFGG